MTTIETMTKDALAEKLYETMQSEYDSYLAFVLQMEPEEIIRQSYSIVTKADILILFEDDDWTDSLSKEQLAAACQMKAPLDGLYQAWLKVETNYMETLEDAVRYRLESYAESLLADPLPTPCRKTEKTKTHHTQQER